MTTLSPSSGPGGHRRSGATLLVIAVGVVALLVGAAGGWFLANNRDDGVAAPTTTQSGCPAPDGTAAAKPAPSPETITVDVYNATSQQGLAGATAAQLEKRGFKIGDVANDPAGKTIAGTAEVRYGKKGKANAQVVAAQVADSTLVNDKRGDKTVGLALGNAYDGLTTQDEAAAALSPSPSATC